MSMELQSMESSSMAGQKQRRFSAGSGTWFFYFDTAYQTILFFRSW